MNAEHCNLQPATCNLQPATCNLKYRALGTYRYLLALLVMLQHFSANAAPEYFAKTLLGYELGTLAVYAFFALSGFVIIEAADTVYQSKPIPFITNRMLRLYPHFLVALLLSMLAHYVLMSMGMLRLEHKIVEYDPKYFAFKNLFMNVLSIFPFTGKLTEMNFVPIAWALRIEILFYFVVLAALFMSKKGVLRSSSLGFHSTCLMLLFVPCFVLSVLNKMPAMFGFLPYFTYGAGLYYITKRAKAAYVIVVVSVFAMMWHFLSLPPMHEGYERYVFSQSLILFGMLAAIALFLKVKLSDKGRRTDKELGNYTYPVYVYHYCLLVIVASVMSDYGWETFITGMVSSIIIAALLTKLLDAKINRLRNSIRGMSL